MHRISAGPASQRDVRHPSHFSPNSAWASRCPAAIGSFQAGLFETIFSVLSTSLLMQVLGGQVMYSQNLVCLGEPLVAVVMEFLPTVIFRSLEQLRSNGRQLATVVDRVAAVRWNARMESSSLRSYASHLRRIAWGCRVFGFDPCQPDILGRRRIAACVKNLEALDWLVVCSESCPGSSGAALAR